MEFKHDGSSENRRGGREHAEQKVRLMEQVYLLDLEAIAPLYPPGFRRPWNSQRRAEKAAEKIFEI